MENGLGGMGSREQGLSYGAERETTTLRLLTAPLEEAAGTGDPPGGFMFVLRVPAHLPRASSPSAGALPPQRPRLYPLGCLVALLPLFPAPRSLFPFPPLTVSAWRRRN
ncbi:MAG: hypothetical protein MdMp014T_0346 [Treponematales bacterium]